MSNHIYLIVARDRGRRQSTRSRDPMAFLMPFVAWHVMALLVSWIFFLELSIEWKIVIAAIWLAYASMLFAFMRGIATRRRHSGGTK